MAKQTHFGTVPIRPNRNISLSYGIFRTVRVMMRHLGLSRFLSGIKSRGVPLDYIVEAMCMYQLLEDSSMNACAEWLSNKDVADVLFGGTKISQKTIDRSLSYLDEYFDDILECIWKGINSVFELSNTDVVVDGSHIPMYGSKSRLSGYGHGGNGVQNQIQFVVSQFRCSPRLPFHIYSYRGNESDNRQYEHFLPRIIRHLQMGSLIVIDNGGATADLLDMIVMNRMNYLTRVKMNTSDDRSISENGYDFQCINSDVCCLTKSFRSSGRTTYVFFSAEKYRRSLETASRKAMKCAKIVGDTDFGPGSKPRKSDYVTVKKNPYVDVDIRITVQKILEPFVIDDDERAVEDLMGDRCGYFKLECSYPMEAADALSIYRSRVLIEHLISSIKSVVNLKPLRVWNESSVNGSLLLALIAQLVISMTMEMLPGHEETLEILGKMERRTVKPSSKKIVESLSHLTVTYLFDEKGHRSEHFSNFDDLNSQIMDILNDIEASESIENMLKR